MFKMAGWSKAARAIADGHAYQKHVVEGNEFAGIKNTDEFATEIDRVMNEAKHTKKLSAGRTAYWDGASGTIVIHNPGAADQGTVFKPVNGKNYFDNLK